MDKIKTIKIKNPDGSISEETYTISVDAKDVDMKNGKDVQDTIGDIDIDNNGNIGQQLKNFKQTLFSLNEIKVNKQDIVDNLETNENTKALSAKQGNNLNKLKATVYDTLADMKADVSLKDGMTAQTLGYYEVNDGGKATYKITNVESETDYQEGLDNELYATLIVDNSTINITQFGAIGDGATDDSAIFQNALNFLENKKIKKLLLEKNKSYYINNVLSIFQDTEIDLNNSTIISGVSHVLVNFKCTRFGWDTNDAYTGYNGNGNIYIHDGIIRGGSISFGHAENIKIENVDFINTKNDHYLEICACKNYKVLNCNFTGLKTVREDRQYVEYIQIDVCNYNSFPWFPEESTTYDGTINDTLLIDNCTFQPGNTEGYNNLYTAIGSHVTPATYHKNITITNNKIDSCSFSAMQLYKINNALIQNNKIINGTGVRGINMQYGCKNIDILDNDINNITGGISALSNTNYLYENIKIKNNNIILSEGPNAFIIHDADNVEFVDNYGYSSTYLVDFTNVLNIVCVNNIYNNSTNTYGTVIYWSGNNSIKILDMYKLILDTNDTTNKVITLKNDITSFNMLKILTGVVSQGNWQELELRAYTGRNFQLGETYKIPFIQANNNIGVIILTIDSSDSKKITYTSIGDLSIRGLYAKVLKNK